jgi:uncharacterized protein
MSTALVTGATAGLGHGFAQALAAQGHDLVLVARDTGRLESVAADLVERAGIAVQTQPTDLADRYQLDRLCERVVDRSAPIDILVNNAGYGLNASFLRDEMEAEQRLLDVLVVAPMRLSHAVLPGMLERGSGALINVSSVAGWVANGTYSAAKAWLTNFTEGLSAQLAGTGVAATAVCPGFVHTEFHQRADVDMSGVPGWLWLSVDQVVDQALKDARRGRAVSVAGTQYRALGLAARYAPRSLVRRATRR